ncbi:MAG: hypothetical protein ABIL77_04330 [candidate division WOR-3 bacterium]
MEIMVKRRPYKLSLNLETYSLDPEYVASLLPNSIKILLSKTLRDIDELEKMKDTILAEGLTPKNKNIVSKLYEQIHERYKFLKDIFLIADIRKIEFLSNMNLVLEKSVVKSVDIIASNPQYEELVKKVLQYVEESAKEIADQQDVKSVDDLTKILSRKRR